MQLIISIKPMINNNTISNDNNKMNFDAFAATRNQRFCCESHCRFAESLIIHEIDGLIQSNSNFIIYSFKQ